MRGVAKKQFQPCEAIAGLKQCYVNMPQAQSPANTYGMELLIMRVESTLADLMCEAGYNADEVNAYMARAKEEKKERLKNIE